MKILIDTNILVYAAGIRATEEKRRQAVDALASARPDACLALQVLTEFSAVALRNGMKPERCRAIVERYLRSWTVLLPSARTLDGALRGVAEHRLSFFDSMLWALAVERGVREIWSEDGPSGATVGRVTYYNPFTS